MCSAAVAAYHSKRSPKSRKGALKARLRGRRAACCWCFGARLLWTRRHVSSANADEDHHDSQSCCHSTKKQDRPTAPFRTVVGVDHPSVRHCDFSSLLSFAPLTWS